MVFTKEEMAILAKLTQNPEAIALFKAGKTYHCNHCSYELVSEKPKRKCPECGKFGLSEITVNSKPVVQTIEKPTEDVQSSFIHRPMSKSKPQPKQDGDEGRRCRIEQIRDINTQFIDTGDFKHETEEFTKKVKFTVGQRTRGEFKMIEAECLKCHKVFSINPKLYRKEWRCNNCIRVS